MADHQSRLAGWSTAHGYEPTALPAMPTKIDALHITFWGHSDINEEKIKQIKRQQSLHNCKRQPRKRYEDDVTHNLLLGLNSSEQLRMAPGYKYYSGIAIGAAYIFSSMRPLPSSGNRHRPSMRRSEKSLAKSSTRADGLYST
ncbi:hypothetical protein PGT21_034411 [Puccinia graminis f. sp. tritici]|uniref:Uncharacterized protein n=1 Tax=Puccinia graminis f. sp. tritici TaxID=56615 RepID=A0A5B0M8Z9_PUCGR|nr:hypothetical protein PGT21_034411 [Puccinia graminis f. sp. tritici]